jgi:hypothetical protein
MSSVIKLSTKRSAVGLSQASPSASSVFDADFNHVGDARLVEVGPEDGIWRHSWHEGAMRAKRATGFVWRD